MKKLYEYQADFLEAYNRAINWAESGCTLQEAIEEIGFDNITLLNPFEEDTDSNDINDLYYGSDNANQLTDKMKNVEVVLSSEYEDCDGYICANMVLKNKNDWKYFKGLEWY